MKAYYSHCMAIYGTLQEQRDIHLLTRLGFEVVNPNAPEVAEEVRRRKAAGDENYMEYFRELMRGCEALAFRALPDARIPAGVFKEIQFAHDAAMLVFELPSGVLSREMSVPATREYLREIGQR